MGGLILFGLAGCVLALGLGSGVLIGPALQIAIVGFVLAGGVLGRRFMRLRFSSEHQRARHAATRHSADASTDASEADEQQSATDIRPT